MIGYGAVRAAAKLWYVKMLSDQQTVPVPRDAPDVVSGAEDPDRVLIVGNGPTHGWGTVTHDLALTGQLARTLTRRTGRAVDVSYVGDETMNLAAVLPWLGERSLAEFDLVLLVLSMNDAVRLTPIHEYGADMERLLTKLALETRPSARIVVAGIHDVASLPHYRGLAARLAQRSADRLNAEVRRIVGRYDGVEFMDLTAPDAEPGRPFGSPQLYAEWAACFGNVCAPALDAARALDTERAVLPRREQEWDWAPAARIVEQAGEGGNAVLERLMREAKEDFGVDLAYISVVDGDRQYYLANNGPVGRSVPLDLSVCKETIRGDEPVVVENTLRDERFKHSPLLDLSQLRFYAGTPLKNAEGDNVGTFCVQSVLPGSRGFDEQRLLQYAAKAQQELQRLAALPQAAREEAGDGERLPG